MRCIRIGGVLVSEPDGIPTFEVVAKTKHSARLSPLGVKVEVQFNASDPPVSGSGRSSDSASPA